MYGFLLYLQSIEANAMLFLLMISLDTPSHFLLNSKSDVFETFVKFKCLIENLFSLKIKQLQIDGGGEYTSHNFTKFLSTHGILH
jgi:hypothetical protein